MFDWCSDEGKWKREEMVNPYESPQNQSVKAETESQPAREKKRSLRFWWAVTGAAWIWMGVSFLSMFWDEPAFQSYFWFGVCFLLLAVFNFWLAMAGPFDRKKR